MSRIELTAQDTRLSKRYPVISPASIAGDYDAHTDEEHRRYGWVGDTNNEVGTAPNKVDGYYMY